MKLKELQITGGTVYLNIVHESETDTATMSATAAVKKYGELEVVSHTPYTPADGGSDGQTTAGTVDMRKGKPTVKPGTDIVILKGA